MQYFTISQNFYFFSFNLLSMTMKPKKCLCPLQWTDIGSQDTINSIHGSLELGGRSSRWINRTPKRYRRKSSTRPRQENRIEGSQQNNPVIFGEGVVFYLWIRKAAQIVRSWPFIKNKGLLSGNTKYIDHACKNIDKILI